MADIGFYHLLRGLDRALPRLLEKVVASGARAVLHAGSEERVEAINAMLWTYDPGSFLPHGSARDGFPEAQPIWLTTGLDNPNSAGVLVLVDGLPVEGAGGEAAPALPPFPRVLDLFDGNDEAVVAAARQRWRVWRDAGHVLTYWQATPSGGWVKKSEHRPAAADPDGGG